ncbi:hypothetical protein ACA910_001827 [Epithemia clementina (nom. ined.)]
MKRRHQVLAFLTAVVAIYALLYESTFLPLLGLQFDGHQGWLPFVAIEEATTNDESSTTTIKQTQHSDNSTDRSPSSNLHDKTSHILHVWSRRTTQREQRDKAETVPDQPDPKQSHRPLRVVYGIMSHDMTERGKYTRQIMRSTFLSFYSKKYHLSLNNVSDAKDQEHWICSFNRLIQGNLKEPEKCRLAYAFVVGANPNGPTILFNYNDSYPLALSSASNGEVPSEADVVYLNIKENMNGGKTPTWFRYATSVLEERGWKDDWDYIFKADSDNLMYPPKFFRTLEKYSPKERPVRNIYGGWMWNVARCQQPFDPQCQLPLETGNIYASGGCLFLSTNLASFISDPARVGDQEKLISMFPHEDMVTGLAVRLYEDERIERIDEGSLDPMDTYRLHHMKLDRDHILFWKALVKAGKENSDFAMGKLEACQIVSFACMVP